MVLYGVVDTGVSYVHVSRDAGQGQPELSSSQLGMDSGVQSGSRWGLKGTDDLGDGWSASFVLEQGINSANGEAGQASRVFGRQSTLGVGQQSFGLLYFGRQPTLSTNYLAAIDPFGESFGQANIGASFGSVNTVRYDNLIQYETPLWHGLQAGIGYSFNTGSSGLYRSGSLSAFEAPSNYFGTDANMRAVTVAARYTRGALNVVGSFDRVFSAGLISSPTGASGTEIVNNPSGVTPTAWILGATYEVESVEVAVAYGRTYDGAFSGNGPGNGWSSNLSTVTNGAGVLFDKGFDSQSAMIGLTIPMGGLSDELMVSWQLQQPQGRLVGNPTFATQSIVGVAYTHVLSNRLNLYFWGSYGNNFQMVSTAKSSVIGAGMRYVF